MYCTNAYILEEVLSFEQMILEPKVLRCVQQCKRPIRKHFSGCKTQGTPLCLFFSFSFKFHTTLSKICCLQDKFILQATVPTVSEGMHFSSSDWTVRQSKKAVLQKALIVWSENYCCKHACCVCDQPALTVVKQVCNWQHRMCPRTGIWCSSWDGCSEGKPL